LITVTVAACIAPTEPISPGYIVDISGTLVLRTFICDKGRPLLFESAAVYPPSAARNNNKLAGQPVWSATSRRGVGLVIIGTSQQPGLTVVHDHPMTPTRHYLVNYTYLGDLPNKPIDPRIADLRDGMAATGSGVMSERDFLRTNPAAFGCP